MVYNSVLVGGSVVMMLIVGGITSFVLFGEDETDDGNQNSTNQVLCRDVNCGSHLVIDDSQRNTIVNLESATHVCCVEKQDENESSDDEDDDEDKSAFGFTISLVLLIAMVALVGFALRNLWKPPVQGGKVGGTTANRVARSGLSSVSNPQNTEASGVERPSAVEPEENTVDKSKLGFFGRQKKEILGSVLTNVNSLANNESVKLHKKVDDLAELGLGKIDDITDKGMGLVLKIAVVIGILIIMILIGVTVFQGQSYFSS